MKYVHRWDRDTRGLLRGQKSQVHLRGVGNNGLLFFFLSLRILCLVFLLDFYEYILDMNEWFLLRNSLTRKSNSLLSSILGCGWHARCLFQYAIFCFAFNYICYDYVIIYWFPMLPTTFTITLSIFIILESYFRYKEYMGRNISAKIIYSQRNNNINDTGITVGITQGSV